MDDDSDEDERCHYGTPLDSYEEDELPKKKSNYQDVSEQYALDNNGKRRFHGAFTGGFTAGHGNTVAAPEGWTPSTFKSSRSDRVQKSQFQKPEDFMDDEDRSEFGIAPRQIRPTSDFGGHKRKNKVSAFHDGPIPGTPVLDMILRPVQETAAMRVLRSMGWRPGKGIGEKITAKEKKAKKLYTCFVPQEFRVNTSANADIMDQEDADDGNDSSEDEEYSKHLFEPDDYEPYVAKPKLDTFGLGYAGLSRHSVLGTFQEQATSSKGEWRGSHLITVDRGKKVSIRGQAFGVGALEEDDEDIYSREDMSNYDFALEGVPLPSKANKQAQTVAVDQNYRKVLEGFVPAMIKYVPLKVYPAPAIPRDFDPDTSCRRRTRFDAASTDAAPIRDRGLGRHQLTATKRGKILGEEEMKVDESLSQAQIAKDMSKTYEERIEAITGRNVNFVSDQDRDKHVEKPKENNEFKGFKPFANNPEKQERYERFVRNKGSFVEDSSEVGDRSRLKEWEKVREKREFEQAYKLYKPMTGLMNERFVSASHALEGPLDPAPPRTLTAVAEKMEAARCGMYGRLTRDVSKWQPEAVLCKRFNVPEPNTGGYVPQSGDKKKTSYSLFEYLESPAYNKESFLKAQTGSNETPETIPIGKNSSIDSSSQSLGNVLPVSEKPSVSGIQTKRLTVTELFLQEKEKERQQQMATQNKLEFQKEITQPETTEVKNTIDNFNKIDLYKAIFLSDSESDAEIEDVKGKKTIVDNKKDSIENVVNPFDSPLKNIERNMSPPKGIFANLDFVKLNTRPNLIINSEPLVQTKRNTEVRDTNLDKKVVGEDTMEVSEEMFGPKLPEKHVFKKKEDRNVMIPKPGESVEVSSSSGSSDEWIEIDKSKKAKSKHKKSKKAKKKSHSHKSKKHKSKRKHSH